MGCQGRITKFSKILDRYEFPLLPPHSLTTIGPGKAYHIKEITKGSYFYPRQDGTGETSLIPRPLKPEELVRITFLETTAFAFSSGTIGAALSASLSKIRSIALSYGTVLHPTPTTLFEPAHRLGLSIICHLWNNWGADEGGLRSGEVDLYSVNIPLIEDLLADEGLKICTTTMWRNSYGRLFKSTANTRTLNGQAPLPAGPDALDITTPGNYTDPIQTREQPAELSFKFSPDMKDLITPSLSSLPVGSDGWAIYQGWVSVTPLRASFGEPACSEVNVEDRIWKLKL
ncbi:hypothetical protein H0H87_000181 [Tephrocybe sp. NHM501043]|nr:hypothetical protein H0H87_000181 [Tephrocybe sp. NHM501043]